MQTKAGVSDTWAKSLGRFSLALDTCWRLDGLDDTKMKRFFSGKDKGWKGQQKYSEQMVASHPSHEI